MVSGWEPLSQRKERRAGGRVAPRGRPGMGDQGTLPRLQLLPLKSSVELKILSETGGTVGNCDEAKPRWQTQCRDKDWGPSRDSARDGGLERAQISPSL